MECALGLQPSSFFNGLRCPAVCSTARPRECITPGVPHKEFRETGKEEKTMNTNTYKRNIFAAAAVLLGTVAMAQAQDITLKANVPFEFSVNRAANLEPGTYTVTRDRHVWVIRSASFHRTVLVVPIAVQGRPDETPSLHFQCVGHQCQLRAIVAGHGEIGGLVPTPKLSKADAAELAFVNVPLEINRGE
jgi:hypothetical protein